MKSRFVSQSASLRKFILGWIVSADDGEFCIPSWRDFTRRAYKRAKIECLNSGSSCIVVANRVIKEIQQEDIAVVCDLCFEHARTFTNRFPRVEVDELISETFIKKLLASVRKGYRAPATANGEVDKQRLGKYIRRIVYRTGIYLCYPRLKNRVVCDQTLVEQAADKLDVVSEIAFQEDNRRYLDAYRRLLALLKPEDRRRLEAMNGAKSKVEAARQVGITDCAFRQWWRQKLPYFRALGSSLLVTGSKTRSTKPT